MVLLLRTVFGKGFPLTFRKRYGELLDSVFLKNGGVSPASLEVLAFMRASKLKNAPDFKEERSRNLPIRRKFSGLHWRLSAVRFVSIV